MTTELMTADGAPIGSGTCDNDMHIEDDRLIVGGDISRLIEAHIEAYATNDEPIETVLVAMPLDDVKEVIGATDEIEWLQTQLRYAMNHLRRAGNRIAANAYDELSARVEERQAEVDAR